MLNEELIEKVVARLTRRLEKGNEYVLQKIGKSLKKLGTLSPTQAQELVQILKYGGDYDKITKKLAEITDLNEKEIYKIFEEIARNDYKFAKQFYEYRNTKYIPFEQNEALKRQINAIAKITADEYRNISKTMAYATIVNGKIKYTPLARIYQRVMDEAILNVGQGKETFDSAMRRTLKQLGRSGLRTVDYDSGKSMRMDSAVRMNLKGGLTQMHEEMQKQLGEEFGADGVEVSVHQFPAPDHEDAQGKMFSTVRPSKNELSEWEKLQEEGVATTYDGEEINMHLTHADGSEYSSHRAIGVYNCYHYTFAVILGVSEPNYTKEQLKEMKERNHKGFKYKGRHYTMYEGTQLQRRLERQIREQKDTQIMAVAEDGKELILESQDKIKALNKEYKELCQASGLPEYKERMRVSGYKKIKVENNDEFVGKIPKNKTVDEWNNYFGEKYGGWDVFNGKTEYKQGQQGWVNIDKNIENVDDKLMNDTLSQLNYLSDKYGIQKENPLDLKIEVNKSEGRQYAGRTAPNGRSIELGNAFLNKDILLQKEKEAGLRGWHIKVKNKDLSKYTITHEYGHVIENTYTDKINNNIKSVELDRDHLDDAIRKEIFDKCSAKTGLSIEELENKYLSGYAKSTKNREWFAELFVNLELGKSNPLSKELELWIKNNIM